MNLLVFFALLVAASAHFDHHDHHDHCGTDCLKACRSCPPLENDGEEGINGTSPFKVGSRHRGDCDQLVCKDRKAVLIVEGQQYDRLVCFQGRWHYGFPTFLVEADSGMCLTPPNGTECDPDATLKFEANENFKCVCNKPFVDRTEEFGRGEDQVCSNCQNKKLNIALLVDNSGSMSSVLTKVKDFIKLLVRFMKVSATGNHIAVVTSSYSYDIKISYGNPGNPNYHSWTETSINATINAISAEGQSYLGSGMEAIKAALVQPAHDYDAYPNKLVVFTDGSVLHSPPRVQDVTRAASNLEALGVETFVVTTNSDYPRQLSAIANGVLANIFPISTEQGEDNFEVVDKLQKRICA